MTASANRRASQRNKLIEPVVVLAHWRSIQSPNALLFLLQHLLGPVHDQPNQGLHLLEGVVSVEDNPHPSLALGYDRVVDGPDAKVCEVTVRSEEMVLQPTVPNRHDMCEEALVLPALANGYGEDPGCFGTLVGWVGEDGLKEVANEVLNMILALLGLSVANSWVSFLGDIYLLGEARLQQAVSSTDGGQGREGRGCGEDQTAGKVEQHVLDGLFAQNDAC